MGLVWQVLLGEKGAAGLVIFVGEGWGGVVLLILLGEMGRGLVDNFVGRKGEGVGMDGIVGIGVWCW